MDKSIVKVGFGRGAPFGGVVERRYAEANDAIIDNVEYKTMRYLDFASFRINKEN